MDVRDEASRRNGRRLMVAATESERGWFARALGDLRQMGQITFVPAAEITRCTDRIGPELIVVSIHGRADGLQTLYELLGPEFAGRSVIAALHEPDPGLGRVFDRLGVDACMVTPRDPSALRAKIFGWIQSRSHRRLAVVPPVTQGNAATESLVATAVRDARTAISAHEVAAGCGLSVVTSRRYLKKLVHEGQAAMDLEHRSVGRPVSLYRWAG
jgi:hypothetical protein